MLRRINNLKNKFSRKSRNNASSNNAQSYRLGVKVIIILFSLGIIFGFLLPFGKIFSDFDTTTQYKELDYPEVVNSEKFSVLLVGLDKKDTHTFVDALSVLIVDKNSNNISLININPDIVIGEESLRRALIAEQDNLQPLVDGVSEILASDVTNYIVLDRVYFEDTDNYTKDILVENIESISDEDVLKENSKSEWSEGSQKVMNCCVYDYLRSDSNGNDEKLLRQLNFYPDYIKSIVPWKLILGIADFAEIFNKNVSTDLDKYEILEIAYALSRTPAKDIDKVYTAEDFLINIGKIGVYNQYYLNFERFDKVLESVLGSPEIALEQPVVEMLNASNQPGLATSKARWMQNSSMNIIHIANSPVKQKTTTVYIQDVENYPATLSRLRSVLGKDLQIVESEYPYRHIGEIVVVLGEDQL